MKLKKKKLRKLKKNNPAPKTRRDVLVRAKFKLKKDKVMSNKIKPKSKKDNKKSIQKTLKIKQKINGVKVKNKKLKKTVLRKSKKRIAFKLSKKSIKINKKTIIKKIRKEPAEPAVKSSSLIESFKPKIKVIGIGGGGGSIVSEIGRSLDKATFVVADTDVRSFRKKDGIKYFLFGQELTHGLGTGLNTDLAKEAAEREKEKISQFFQDQDIVIFVVCLGGGLGSGATQVFLDTAKDFGGITLGIFTLPFKFEGKSKHKIALKALKELRKYLNVSLTIPNERIFKVINEDTAITQAFSMVNKSLIESLESLIDLIQSHGLINIDFADLRTILQGRGNLAFLNTAEAFGKGKADNVIKNVLNNPLYQDSFTPEKVLFNIEGGRNLSMFEVDKISKAIAGKNPKAKIIFGISKNSKHKNKIKTTLLMTGSAPSAVQVPTQKVKEILAEKNISEKINIKKVKTKKQKVKNKQEKIKEEKIPILGNLQPVFGNVSVKPEGVKNISIAKELQDSKKAIRRTALEIKKAEELEKNRKSKQEEEWEIPAFLRFKKVK